MGRMVVLPGNAFWKCVLEMVSMQESGMSKQKLKSKDPLGWGTGTGRMDKRGSRCVQSG